jgi:hypothetical protein
VTELSELTEIGESVMILIWLIFLLFTGYPLIGCFGRAMTA